jgi:hypothetical protein
MKRRGLNNGDGWILNKLQGLYRTSASTKKTKQIRKVRCNFFFASTKTFFASTKGLSADMGYQPISYSKGKLTARENWQRSRINRKCVSMDIAYQEVKHKKRSI